MVLYIKTKTVFRHTCPAFFLDRIHKVGPEIKNKFITIHKKSEGLSRRLKNVIQSGKIIRWVEALI